MTKTARYDEVADFYQAGWADDLDDPVSVSLLDLIGELDGRRVLDLACGHGRVSRGLARRGAAVVGVDLSATMIDNAIRAERAEPLGIRYLQADASAVPPAIGNDFEIACCSFGLSDIDDLDGVLDTVSRVLVPGGSFVFSLLHPCFGGGDEVSGSWPSDGGYADEGWWRADGDRSTLRRQVGANHRTLSTYLNACRRRGLVLDQLSEPAPAVDWARTRPTASRGPVFLVARFVRSRSDAL